MVHEYTQTMDMEFTLDTGTDQYLLSKNILRKGTSSVDQTSVLHEKVVMLIYITNLSTKVERSCSVGFRVSSHSNDHGYGECEHSTVPLLYE